MAGNEVKDLTEGGRPDRVRVSFSDSKCVKYNTRKIEVAHSTDVRPGESVRKAFDRATNEAADFLEVLYAERLKNFRGNIDKRGMQ